MAKISISLPDELKEDLDDAVDYPETRSDVVQDAIRLYLSLENENDPELETADA